MPVTFTTLYRRKPGHELHTLIVRFTRETVGDRGQLFDVNIWPDGSVDYAVGCKQVDKLPDLPSTRELLACAERHKPLALDILAHPDDSREQREAYWKLREAMESDQERTEDDHVQAVPDAPEAPAAGIR